MPSEGRTLRPPPPKERGSPDSQPQVWDPSSRRRPARRCRGGGPGRCHYPRVREERRNLLIAPISGPSRPVSPVWQPQPTRSGDLEGRSSQHLGGSLGPAPPRPRPWTPPVPLASASGRKPPPPLPPPAGPPHPLFLSSPCPSAGQGNLSPPGTLCLPPARVPPSKSQAPAGPRPGSSLGPAPVPVSRPDRGLQAPLVPSPGPAPGPRKPLPALGPAPPEVSWAPGSQRDRTRRAAARPAVDGGIRDRAAPGVSGRAVEQPDLSGRVMEEEVRAGPVGGPGLGSLRLLRRLGSLTQALVPASPSPAAGLRTPPPTLPTPIPQAEPRPDEMRQERE